MEWPRPNFASLCFQREFADALLMSAEGEEIPVHRSILALSSMSLVDAARGLQEGGANNAAAEPRAKVRRLPALPRAVLHSLLQHVYGVPIELSQHSAPLWAHLREAALEFQLPKLVDCCNAALRACSVDALPDTWLELFSSGAALDWQRWLCWRLVGVCGSVGDVAMRYKAFILANPSLAIEVMKVVVANEPSINAGTPEERTVEAKTLTQLYNEPNWKDLLLREGEDGEHVMVHLCVLQAYLPHRVAGYAMCREGAERVVQLHEPESRQFVTIMRCLYGQREGLVQDLPVSTLIELAHASSYWLAAEQPDANTELQVMCARKLLRYIERDDPATIVTYLEELSSSASLLESVKTCSYAAMDRLTSLPADELTVILDSEAATDVSRRTLVALVGFVVAKHDAARVWCEGHTPICSPGRSPGYSTPPYIHSPPVSP